MYLLYLYLMFCVCLLAIFLIKLLLEPDKAYFGICLYLYLYSHLNLMFCICLLTLFLIMLLLVILSQISKQPCGSSVAWSECRIVQEASAHSVWDTCVYLDSQLQNLYFCICNMKLISISTARFLKSTTAATVVGGPKTFGRTKKLEDQKT